MFANHDKIRLRWRFDFSNGRVKYGQWSIPAYLESDMAARQLREGLVRAAIEAQCVITDEVSTVAECDGWDFVNFKWVSETFGAPVYYQKIIGLTIVTRDEELTVFVSGEAVTNPRTDADKKFNYAIFGK